MIKYLKDSLEVRISSPKPFAKNVAGCLVIDKYLQSQGYSKTTTFFDRDTVVIRMYSIDDLTRFALEYGHRSKNFTAELA